MTKVQKIAAAIAMSAIIAMGVSGCGPSKYDDPNYQTPKEKHATECLEHGGSYSYDDLGNEKCVLPGAPIE